MAFFDRFRQDLRRYADGVHELGPSLTDAQLAQAKVSLAAELREFYRSWNGARLFFDSVVLQPMERLDSGERGIRLGEAFGTPLEMDAAGRIFEVDEQGDAVLAGSSLEKWLGAVMAREALLFDRQGEWKDVFSDSEGTISDAVRLRRNRAGQKADPQAAVFCLEAAEAAFESGRTDEAEEALERAVELDPEAGVAWELLGSLRRRAGSLDEAERCFGSAGAATRAPVHRAHRFSEAARAARERGHLEGALAWAAQAQLADPQVAARTLAEAEERLRSGDADGALNLAQLATALDPAGSGPQLEQKARARRSLTLV